MTNYERIKKLSIDDFAKFIDKTDCGICAYRFTDKCLHIVFSSTVCTAGIKEWLNKEYKKGSLR